MATLTHVLQKAFKDPEFLQELIKDNNLNNALSNANIELSKEDIVELEKMLQDKKEITGRELLEVVNFYNTGVISVKRGIPVWGGP